jgi:transposase
MYRELRPLFHELTVADPAKLWNRRTDRGAKTDRRDALRMAEMLYRGEIKGIYVPDERTQDLRVLVRGKGESQPVGDQAHQRDRQPAAILGIRR